MSREVKREYATFTVVCDECGNKYDSQNEWLREDPCMPDRGNAHE